MNIFYLNDNAQISAQEQCDKHVCKMAIEYCQLLSTAHRVLDGAEYYDKTKNGRKIKRWLLSDDRELNLMKASHVNHPSNIWTRECAANYDWLLEMWVNTCYEFEYRYGKKHATLERLKYLTNRPKNIRMDISRTEMPQAMPEYCKVANNPIQGYKNYYINEKKRFATWKKRQIPNWYVKGLNNGNEDLGQDVA